MSPQMNGYVLCLPSRPTPPPAGVADQLALLSGSVCAACGKPTFAPLCAGCKAKQRAEATAARQPQPLSAAARLEVTAAMDLYRAEGCFHLLCDPSGEFFCLPALGKEAAPPVGAVGTWRFSKGSRKWVRQGKG